MEFRVGNTELYTLKKPVFVSVAILPEDVEIGNMKLVKSCEAIYNKHG